MNNVKVPYDVFIALVKHHLLDDDSQDDRIRDYLQDKVDKMAARQEYAAMLERRKNGV